MKISILTAVLLSALCSTPAAAGEAAWAYWPDQGRECIDAAKYRHVVDAYKEEVLKEPWDYGLWFTLGYAYDHMGAYSEAADAYGRASELKPDAPIAKYRHGTTLARAGMFREAVGPLTEGLKDNPYPAEAYQYLGIAYVNLGMKKEAVESFRRAVALDPKDAGAHYSLGHAYLVSGDKASAMDEFKALTALDAKLAGMLQEEMIK